ncbi:MAG: hypothetical protein ACREMY_10095, partial [bacterium]
MAVSIKHTFVSAVTDENNPGEVGPTEWNDEHEVTGLDAAAVGLGNVDNTSDASKPVSDATQAALDLKANTADLGTAAFIDVGISDGDVVQVQTGGKLPALDGSDLTNLPTGSGDMSKSTYDPNSVEADAFDQDNMVDGTTNKNFSATEKTKLSGIESLADVTGAANVAAAGAVMTSALDTDGTLAANSDSKVATQKAVKTYADALIGATDAVVFKGAVDCSANPNYPAADAGHLYRVSVAGKIGGASGKNVEQGDELLC